MGEGGAAADAGDRLIETTASLPGLRVLAGQSLLFAMGGFAQKAVGIILVPVLARTLTVADFGRLEVLSVLSTTLSAVGLLGIDIVITRRWADVDADGRRRAFSTWLAIVAAVGLAVAVAALAAAPAIDQALFEDADQTAALRLVGAGVAMNLLLLLGLTALRNQQRARAYAAVAAGASLANGVFVVLLLRAREDTAAVLAGNALALGLGAAAALWLTRRVVFARPSRMEASILLVAALPLVPGIALTAGGDLAARFIVLGAAGPTEVGYLSIALRFAAIGLLLLVGFQLAWHPRAYSIADLAPGLARLRADARALLSGLAVLTVGLAAFAPELLRLAAGSDYAGALAALGWGLLIPATTGLLTVATLPITIAREMRALGTATAFAAVASVLLTLLLTPPLNAAGAAAALALGPLLGAVVAWRLTERRSLPGLASTRSLLLLAVAAVLTLALTTTSPPALAARSLLLLAFCSAAVAVQPDLAAVARLVRSHGREGR